MRIDRIHVDAFGRLRDRRVEPAPGLTLIRGANEAGKSTLLAFIRAILFGFETNRYTVDGVRRGGGITVAMASGDRYRITRYGPKGGAGELQVIDEASGTDRPGVLSERILAGMDRTVFENIHAFGLDELASLQNLRGEALMARIYGASEGTGRVSAIDIETGLSRSLDELWKPDGTKPELNVLLAQLRQVETDLATRDLPAEHGELTARLAETRAAVAAVEAELEAMRRFTELGRAIDPWLRLTAARRDLRELGPVTPIAPDAVERLASLQEREEGMERALGAAHVAREDLVARRAAIAIDDVIRAEREAVAELTSIAHDDVIREGKREGAETRVAQAGDGLRSALADLGPGWDGARLASFDASLALEGEIDDRFRDRMERTVRALEAAELAARQASAEAATVRARVGAETTRRPAGGGAAKLRAVAPVVVGLAGAGALIALGAPPAAAAVAVVLGVVMALIVARAERGAAAVASGELADVRAANERLEVATRTLDAARSDASSATAEWSAWLVGHGLPADLGRATAAGVIAKARAAKVILGQLRTAEGDLERLDAERVVAFQRARSIAASLGLALDPGAGRDAVARLAADAERRLGEADVAAERARDADGRIVDADRAIEQAAAAVTAVRTELADLLATNGAADPSELRRRAEVQAKAREIQAEGKSARQALLSIRGEAALEALEAELGALPDLGALRGKVDEETVRQPERQARRDALLNQEGELAGRIAQLERSSDRSVLQQRREDLLARIELVAERWTVRSLAREMLGAARREYEDAHRPDVIAAAERHLARITRGRYQRILSPNGRELGEVRGSDDRQVPIGDLSLGTAQQLYFALRLGLIEHLGTQREPLPVVMDDVLVNFDPERAELAARSIEGLATRTQVIYFTCHPDVALRADLTIDLEPLGPPAAP